MTQMRRARAKCRTCGADAWKSGQSIVGSVESFRVFRSGSLTGVCGKIVENGGNIGVGRCGDNNARHQP
jgi:hypothetical protein